MNDSLTAAVLIEVKAKIESDLGGQRLCIGIVCRPDAAELLQTISRDHTARTPFGDFGIPIYIDEHQEQSWLAFYDHDLLKSYLNRYNA